MRIHEGLVRSGPVCEQGATTPATPDAIEFYRRELRSMLSFLSCPLSMGKYRPDTASVPVAKLGSCLATGALQIGDHGANLRFRDTLHDRSARME
jgi:hypothetical protein